MAVEGDACPLPDPSCSTPVRVSDAIGTVPSIRVPERPKDTNTNMPTRIRHPMMMAIVRGEKVIVREKR